MNGSGVSIADERWPIDRLVAALDELPERDFTVEPVLRILRRHPVAIDSLQPYLGIAASEKFLTPEGAEITPELRLGYGHEVLSNNQLFTVAATDGTRFVARGVKPSRDALTAGAGLTLRAQDNLLLYANYDAVLPTGNTTNHTVSAGLRIRF